MDLFKRAQLSVLLVVLGGVALSFGTTRNFTQEIVFNAANNSATFHFNQVDGQFGVTTGVDVSYIKNINATPRCYTIPMTKTATGWEASVTGVSNGDSIEYFFTHRIDGRDAEIPMDTKWFFQTIGKAPPDEPNYPLIVEGSERYRDRHENEWRFDHFVQAYFERTTYNFKLEDRGTSLHVTLYPSEQTNWADFRWFNHHGLGSFCDRHEFSMNAGVINNMVGMHTGGSPWGEDYHWYDLTIEGLNYGQKIDIEFTAMRTLTVKQYYSEVERYYMGEGRIGQEYQHPWAKPAGRASINEVSVPFFDMAQHVVNTIPGRVEAFMFGKALFDTDWETGFVINFPTASDCNSGLDPSQVSNPVANRFTDVPSPFFTENALGPLYKHTSCFGCHYQDGKGFPEIGYGHFADNNETFDELAFTMFCVGDNCEPHELYGSAIQTKAIPGFEADGNALLTWSEEEGFFDDGSRYSLRRPTVRFTNMGYGGTMPANVKASPRFIMHLSGMGLLEAIPEWLVDRFADEEDANGDGISGRKQMVYDDFEGRQVMGRFGWKAALASIKSELYFSIAHDLGISNPTYKEEWPASEPRPPVTQPEISDESMDLLITYVSLIAPPIRRPKDTWRNPSAVRGKDLFVQAKCHLCHIPAIRTGEHHMFEELSYVEAQPFTDMLLHDMGPRMDDGFPEGIAMGSEWRTSPMWGLISVDDVNGHTLFLHDGRARDLNEAILWHEGEGLVSKQIYLAMSQADRNDLIAYSAYPFADKLPSDQAATDVFGVIPVRKPVINNNSLVQFNVAPNPVRNLATFSLNQEIKDAKLSIFNIKGKLVGEPKDMQWDASTAGPGRYFAHLTANGKLYKKSFLVVK